jgi:hypothetical protein
LKVKVQSWGSKSKVHPDVPLAQAYFELTSLH